MKTFTGAMSLPAPVSSYNLVDSDSNQIISDNFNIVYPGSVYGFLHFDTSFSGSLTLGHVSLSSSYDKVKTFTGAMTLPHTDKSYYLTSPSYTTLTSPTWRIISAGSAVGVFTIVHHFQSTLSLPVMQVHGAFEEVSHFFQGALVLPKMQVNSFRSGRSRKNVIFMNENPKSFDNSAINNYIDAFFPQVGTGSSAISGSGAFDPHNNIIGTPQDIPSASAQRSVTLRAPNLGNKQRPTIDPQILIMMSGDFKTHVELMQYDISLSWKLLNCTDVLATRIIGLLYFDTIRYVIGDETWRLVLLDDVIRTIQEVRKRQTITLNFKGVRL